MLIVKQFHNSTCRIIGDMARTREALRTDGRTDVRTDGHTRSQDLYMSPAGRHIITKATCATSVFAKCARLFLVMK